MTVPLHFTIHNVNDRTIFRPTIDISTWVAIITCRLTYYYTVWNLSKKCHWMRLWRCATWWYLWAWLYSVATIQFQYQWSVQYFLWCALSTWISAMNCLRAFTRLTCLCVDVVVSSTHGNSQFYQQKHVLGFCTTLRLSCAHSLSLFLACRNAERENRNSLVLWHSIRCVQVVSSFACTVCPNSDGTRYQNRLIMAFMMILTI